ncbi:hypothetical protein H5410_024268 [Solanum commersonii]|uniref:DUF4283 domain-containing protein n=1 Tax=Solanum commersonii TaxID=4109 RepID=A0A9J5ZLH5_SOLCO|nr:hypothetical protein H5410_024268 [Solanum commersonii]
MTTKSPGQPPTGVDLDLKEREPASRLDFLAAVRRLREANAMALKPIVYLHGEPKIIWEEEDVERMIVKENLEYAVIGKFSYGLHESIIKAGLLHIASWVEISNANVEVGANNDPEEETSTAMAWISFPSLPPNFLVKEAVFSLVVAVGKPLQGHDEEQCYVLHPDLYPKEKVRKEKEMETGEERREIQGKEKVQMEGNILGKESEEFKIHTNRRGAGRGRQGGGKPEQMWHKKNIQHEKEGITTGNKFGALKDQDKCGETQGGQKERGGRK